MNESYDGRQPHPSHTRPYNLLEHVFMNFFTWILPLYSRCCGRLLAAYMGTVMVVGSCRVNSVTAQDEAPKLRLSENVPALQVADGLELDLLLQEPAVANPLYLNFDHRGRLWVVQFRQYPWPAGLKLLSRDNVWRNVYQPAFPPPPPHADDSPFRGRDQITIHEDTNGDGVFDQHRVFLDGLNLATAALPGRGGVFVMNPPYLLFYADHDQDDVPDSTRPKILLSGFGIEDTHSIGNSLRWGPDGWIYGTQGSTVSGAIVRHDPTEPLGQPLPDEAPIHTMGQNIWRYHPEHHKYEVFAEGGGNAFGVEFDSVGRVYSGHNGGDTRGFHYVQGGYYSKNFGKHGLHSNPFTFSYYGAMRHHAVERFTHTFKIYDADTLPPLYHGKLISISPVLHNVMLSDIVARGSTRMTKDIAPIVAAGTNERDNWFTPVDIQIGPDGAMYVADWYSMQSNHYRNHEGQTNPDLGRIYRLRNATQRGYPVFDLSTQSSRELVEQGLRHPNRWYREMALRLLGDRKDQTVVPLLQSIAITDQDPHALEALWALHLCNGLDDATAEQLLEHEQSAVRGWTIRLLADRGDVSDSLAQRFARLAEHESDVEVRLQLACSCRRLPTRVGLELLSKLLLRSEDAQDPLMPNAIWWGTESHAGNHAAISSWLQQSAPWRSPLADAAHVTSNLMRRWAILGTREDLLMCAELLRLSPDATQSTRLLEGFTRAFEGRTLPPLPTELVDQLSRVEGRFAMLLGIRRGEAASIEAALTRVADVAVSGDERGQLIRALGEVQAEQAVPVLLRLLLEGASDGITASSMTALQGFDRAEIGATIVEQFSRMSPPQQETAQSVLASRPSWSQQLIQAIEAGNVDAKLINQDTVSRLAWHRDPELQSSVSRLFPKSPDDARSLDQRIELVEKIVLAGNGNPLQGQRVFHETGTCGKCHQMFGRGGAIGPDLTSYNRSNLRTMLLGIIHPDAEIREGFENLTALTDDGQVITGFKVDEDANTLVLRAVDGQSRAIDKSGIEELHQNKTSLMPTGLLDGLSDNELRDLFAFLTSTTPPN
ncbi:MAG: c-type cytochrome [Pirellulaceae bacterium]|nr:c-type cytochrome [Pirellulaceae bacterium]